MNDLLYNNLDLLDDNDPEKNKMFQILENEAESVRNKDKVLIKSLFGNFYNKTLNVGIGFKRAYGSILSGDYFDLKKLCDGNYLFVFADISGHGLPAYTSLIRLRSAITMAINELPANYMTVNDSDFLIRNIIKKFTDIMDDANSDDFASVIFTLITNDGDKYNLKFYNRGMLFPMVLRYFNGDLIDLYDLNTKEKGWVPRKGNLLGSEFRKLLGDKYYKVPSCEFDLYEGDRILFYSDGIIESSNGHEEFDVERLKKILSDYPTLFPQAIINIIYDSVFEFITDPAQQKDDMTAVLIDFPLVRI